MTIENFFIVVIALFIIGSLVSLAVNLFIAPMTPFFTLVCVAPSVAYAVAGVVNYAISCR